MSHLSKKKLPQKTLSQGLNLNKYLILALGITCTSIVTATIVSWSNSCSSKIDSSSNTNTEIVAEDHQSPPLIWLYAAILLSCSAAPWSIAYLLKPKTPNPSPKRLTRSSPPIPKAKTVITKTPAKEFNQVVKTEQPLSYRLGDHKPLATYKTSLSTQSQTLRLPFEESRS